MRKYLALWFGAAVLAATAQAHAFCMIVDSTYAKDGWKSGDNRQMTVADEFRTSDYVLVGKVVSQRERPLDGDGLLVATDSQVRFTSIFKGNPSNPLTIYDPRDSAGFGLINGKTYLLFVSHFRGRNIIDNCGWSDEISQSSKVLRDLEHRADFSKRPSHCWKNKKFNGCIPDLRTYPGGKKPEGSL